MSNQSPLLHIAMYPWFAMGHLTSFLHLSNKLAERGHRISFFTPLKTQQKLVAYNLHPDRIAFIPISVPHVDGLPPGAETTADIPFASNSLLATAMELTRPAIQQALSELKPSFVFFDFAYWLPDLLRQLGVGIKSIFYSTGPATIAYVGSPDRKLLESSCTEADLMKPPPSFPPSSSIKLRTHEARKAAPFFLRKNGAEITFIKRVTISTSNCDAIAFKACREMGGPYCEYVETQWKKPVILAGPVLPESPTTELEEKWAKWLDGFKAKTTIYCAFGSECILNKDQFQELLLGLELTGLPFFAALKSPMGFESIESALPDGFKERSQGRGIVHGGWVQQPLILRHPSVGCFVTHCGAGSSMEGILNECQLVLLPNAPDQVINARVLGGDLKVGVEVEKGDEDGLFTRKSVCKAVKAVMDDDSEVGKEVRANNARLRECLSSEGLEASYIDSLVQKLHALL